MYNIKEVYMTEKCYVLDSLLGRISYCKCYGSNWTHMTSFVKKLRIPLKG